jgi:hypothetical protein
MEVKAFLGFDFVKVGTFYLGSNAYKYKDRLWNKPTQIDFIDDEYVNSECSTYVVCLGDSCRMENILYVGEYTNSLMLRWFRKHNQPSDKKINEWVTWHSDNLDNNLNKLLQRVNDNETDVVTDWDARTENKKVAIESNIKAMLEDLNQVGEKPTISLWLTYDPWVKVSSEVNLNISLAIEQVFLESDLCLPLNSKGRTKPPKNTLSVKAITENGN